LRFSVKIHITTDPSWEGFKIMNKRLLLAFMMIVSLVLAACNTRGTRDDATSAQSLQPAIAGFTTTDLDTGLDAIALSAGTGAAATGNVPLALAIERANSLLQCLQDIGAVSGLLYLQSDPGIIPQTGASLVVNKTRVNQNMFGCLGSQVLAQTVLDFEVCAANGQFTAGGDSFWFAYVGVGTDMCNGFRSHFSANNAAIDTLTVEGTYP
jgi:predicted small secreted protein